MNRGRKGARPGTCHTTESLFWSLFGLTDLETFGIDKPEFQITRQTGVALFGLYQVLIVVVAINMLMTRSFEIIVVRFFIQCSCIAFKIHLLEALKCRGGLVFQLEKNF